MPTYHRETWIAAPLEEVWAFSVRADGLEQVTPEFMNLQVGSVTGPDGETDPEELTVGTRIEASVRPFDVGPRQTWVSRITEREEGEDRAYFRDVMEEGPFPHWEHTHRFYASESSAADDDGKRGGATRGPAGEETLLSDRVEYRLPFGALGERVSEFAEFGFEPLFRYRHRRTRELLE